jgi:hypothetical protein
MLGALNSPEHSDVELHADGTSMRAHRAMLAARSPRFQAYFLTGRREERAQRIEARLMGNNAISTLINAD